MAEERDLEYYRKAVENALGEPSDTGVILLVMVCETHFDIAALKEYTGFNEKFVDDVLWRVDIFDLLNGIKWHENDIEFIMAVFIAEGRAIRLKNKDGEWLYKMYDENQYGYIDGRQIAQQEANAIQRKYEVTRKEAWELRRERTYDIDQISIDGSVVDPFEEPINTAG